MQVSNTSISHNLLILHLSHAGVISKRMRMKLGRLESRERRSKPKVSELTATENVLDDGSSLAVWFIVKKREQDIKTRRYRFVKCVREFFY